MRLVQLSGFGFPYGDAFPDGQVESLCKKHGVNYRKRMFSPEVTMKLWLSQIISGGASCSEAVARLSAYYTQKGREMSTRTGGYVQARQRLQIEIIKDLVRLSARRLEGECRDYWLIDRPVWTVDGTASVAADTDSICETLPKSKQRDAEFRLPHARIITINSATTGAILSLRFGPMAGKGTGEMSLFRDAWPDLMEGDVLVGDRLYCGYAAMALLGMQGVATVFRRNKMLQTASLPSVQKLGHHDRIVEIERISRSSKALPDQLWKLVPKTQQVRVMSYKPNREGQRESNEIRLVSTLLSPSYTAGNLADIYKSRWWAEIDFRSFKRDLGVNRLRCQSIEMVEKELWMAALANNVIRIYMVRAAKRSGLHPRQVSFKRTMDFLDRYASKMDQAGFIERGRLMNSMLANIAEQAVGDRPGRYEPRALKHKGIPYRTLKHSRHEARARRLYRGEDKKPYRRKRNG